MRFSVGAVNVGTGNFVYFDNTTSAIAPAAGLLSPRRASGRRPFGGR
jgi:NTE family protein